MNAILVTGLEVTLGVAPRHTQVLRGLDLTVSAGRFVAIMGKSGSGKSTLLHALSGLITPDAGSVLVHGRAVDAMSRDQRLQLRRETVGLVHQSDLIIPELTASENIELILNATGIGADEARIESQRLLYEVGLASYEDRFPRELSRGQCQRVGIARAMSGRRSILLADEPSSALDRENSTHIFALFRELADAGRTVVVATHDPLVSQFCTDRYTLEDGLLRSDRGWILP